MKKKYLVFYLVIFLILFFVGFEFSRKAGVKNSGENISATVPDKFFSATDLLPFDGTDNSQPIYIGLNGLVYDVSSGRDFYKTGGPYHYLAGRDSSAELNLIGGNIIKAKYPVVGKIVK